MTFWTKTRSFGITIARVHKILFRKYTEASSSKCKICAHFIQVVNKEYPT